MLDRLINTESPYYWKGRTRTTKLPPNPSAAIANKYRARLRSALKHDSKKSSISELLGIPFAEFKRRLEKEFTRGMDWNNYGVAWIIKYKTPCWRFDLRDEKQLKKCFHWTNFTPGLK